MHRKACGALAGDARRRWRAYRLMAAAMVPAGLEHRGHGQRAGENFGKTRAIRDDAALSEASFWKIGATFARLDFETEDS
jgi:hypothetical protein